MKFHILVGMDVSVVGTVDDVINLGFGDEHPGENIAEEVVGNVGDVFVPALVNEKPQPGK
jgi:hypothetical protein